MSMPFCAICIDSLALRVSASSDGSQPNSAARRRRTVTMFRPMALLYCTGSMFAMSM